MIRRAERRIRNSMIYFQQIKDCACEWNRSKEENFGSVLERLLRGYVCFPACLLLVNDERVGRLPTSSESMDGVKKSARRRIQSSCISGKPGKLQGTTSSGQVMTRQERTVGFYSATSDNRGQVCPQPEES
eukprot:scaffold7329_cov117-Cylindrotheca_fusiformis.AAC.4